MDLSVNDAAARENRPFAPRGLGSHNYWRAQEISVAGAQSQVLASRSLTLLTADKPMCLSNLAHHVLATKRVRHMQLAFGIISPGAVDNKSVAVISRS